VSDTSYDHLTRRLDRLERENRRLKLLGGLALLGVAAVTVMGQSTPAPVANTLEAERFVLRDGAGNVRATLGLRPDGSAALALADDTQQDRAVLSVTAPGQASVDLSDRAGHLRAGLGVRADGTAQLALLDQTDRPRVELKAYGDGRPSLALLDQSGRPRSLLALTAEGATGLTLYDRNGRRRSAMGTEPSGAPAVWLYDVEGNGRAVLADAGGKGRLWLRVSADFQLPFLSLHDRDGKQRVAMLLQQGGVPRLALGDAAERVIWKAP
jgi:hypothetical protein